jgi:DNA-binding beta-propeller fold protein YncE
MCNPYSLAVDKQGFVLVADYSNNRIVVVNPTLSEARPLSLPIDANKPISQPLAMWLDESRGRLYVGEHGGQRRVLVFDNIFNFKAAFTPTS